MNTLPRGINRRIHGNIKALLEQGRGGYDFNAVKELMKFISAEFDGYPKVREKIRYHGQVIERERPASLAGQSESVALILCTTIQAFADERGLYLYEYDESVEPPQPFRTVGGRTRVEMERYIAELRDGEEIARAVLLEKKPRWKYEEGDE